MQKRKVRSIDIGGSDDEDSRDGDMQDEVPQAQSNAHGVIKDIEYLKNIKLDYSVPSSNKERDLRACMGCKLILTE